VNLPNTISAVRIATTPLIAILPFVPSVGWRAVAFLLFLASAISDHIDGRIARSRGLVTDLGKLLDPLADKLLLVATFVPMYAMQAERDDWFIGLIPGAEGWTTYPFVTFGIERIWFPSFVLVLIVLREVWITWFRAYAKERGVIVPAQSLGKWKAVFQFIWMGAAYFWFTMRLLMDEGRLAGPAVDTIARVIGGIGGLSMVVAFVLTLGSIFSYLMRHGQVLGQPRKT
jgi:CDP-diacylglycerol--glycerol-3-phosphate 3-phosphatidyltransferase